ncbi:MAG: uroporphyrinogen decarboxylase family protein [Spirochaetota bacterium]
MTQQASQREHIRSLFAHTAAAPGFWIGNPHADTWTQYRSVTGMDEETIRTELGDECRFISAEWFSYQHPEKKSMFNPYLGVTREKGSHAEAGCFAECDSIREVESHPWPSLSYLDFTSTIDRILAHADKAIFSGFWSPFFHRVSDYFGMENFFIKMYTHPAVVDAVTAHIVDFYVEANRRFLAAAGDNVDVLFIANDLGTQQDVIISPELFERFILPGIRRLAAVGREFGKPVMMHSCGAISRIIPQLIDAGICALHPLQPTRGMDAATLAREYKNDLVFVGGVDTQELLPRGTSSDVSEEVKRLMDTLGPNYIVSPSHEGILPDIPFENVRAMADAVHSTERYKARAL